MANLRTKVISTRWKTFYKCDCPETPASRRDRDIIDWYMRHLNNCPPRPVVNLYLPEFEGTE